MDSGDRRSSTDAEGATQCLVTESAQSVMVQIFDRRGKQHLTFVNDAYLRSLSDVVILVCKVISSMSVTTMKPCSPSSGK
jgi:hypothetical protein